ncbi:hypothetical protein DPMN_096428 [Dreissena polymorpha]|uniref:Uncharacterized protein n=1 Tax=Dreissena polymorpha TaxID=45954 RepID=A0A9D4L9R1_DREPO|nr:hypothetical protein DPMN_096428 [Dreissena polymorpha]
MGQIYIMTLRKVQIFGFRNSGDKQLNFLIDENETRGKDGKMTHGPNAVLSMIDWARTQLQIHLGRSLFTPITVQVINNTGVFNVYYS